MPPVIHHLKRVTDPLTAPTSKAHPHQLSGLFKGMYGPLGCEMIAVSYDVSGSAAQIMARKLTGELWTGSCFCRCRHGFLFQARSGCSSQVPLSHRHRELTSLLYCTRTTHGGVFIQMHRSPRCGVPRVVRAVGPHVTFSLECIHTATLEHMFVHLCMAPHDCR